MTYAQYLVYIALFSDKELTVSEIGTELGLDSGTLTPLLKRMESKGQIVRFRDASDERKVKVSLTVTARELEPDIAEMQFQVSCSTGLDPAEFVELRENIKRLTKNLGDNISV